MTRWTAQEHEALDTLKSRLKDQLAASPQYPEVVGERKMIRFLRGHGHDVEKVCGMMANFLQWRIDKNVNEIRKDIVERGCDHPLRFPKGEIILKLIPQLVVLPEALDKMGSPICVEQYNFVPSEVFKHINIDDYILFVMYSLEYRSLVVEQLSERRESAFLAKLTPEEREEMEKPGAVPYGVLVNTCVLRDLNGVGFTHLSAQGQDIIKAVITVASDNYPELMRKCYMINTPFIFNAVWFVIKGLLAARTLAKVSVRGSGYLDELLQEIDFDSLPAMVGGGYKGFVTYAPYAFDLDYFLPGGRSDTSVTDGSDAVVGAGAEAPDGVDIVGLPGTVSLQDSDLLGAVEGASPEKAADASTGTTSSASEAPAPLSPTEPSAREGTSAAAAGSAGNSSSKKAVPVAVLDPVEEVDFNIISLRTSGF